MSTYEKLPTDDLVMIACVQADGVREAFVNDTPMSFQCTEILNQYYKRDYNVTAHSLVHEREGWFNAAYFVGTWTMSKQRSTNEKSQ